MVCYQIACIDITFFLGYADGCVNVGVRGDQDSGDAHVDREWWCPCLRWFAYVVHVDSKMLVSMSPRTYPCVIFPGPCLQLRSRK